MMNVCIWENGGSKVGMHATYILNHLVGFYCLAALEPLVVRCVVGCMY